MNDSAAVITAIIGIGNRLYFILYPTPDTTIIAARLGVNDEISFSPLHKWILVVQGCCNDTPQERMIYVEGDERLKDRVG